MAPKLKAATNFTLEASVQALKWQVMYGSIAAVLGSAGQASYAAANAALEGLASKAASQGNNVVNVAWGAWGSVGMAAHDTSLESRLQGIGVLPLTPQAGLKALDGVLSTKGSMNICSHLIVADLNWGVLLHRNQLEELPFYAEVSTPRRTSGSSDATGGPQFYSPPATEKSNILGQTATITAEEAVHRALQQVLGHDTEADEPLMSAGLDSIGVGEVRSVIEKSTGLTLPSTLIFDYPTKIALITFLDGRLMEERANTQALSRTDPVPTELPGTKVKDQPNDKKVPDGHEVEHTEPPNGLPPGLAIIREERNQDNHNAPCLSLPGYYTVPSLKRLARLSDSELRQVPRFVIGRQGVGEVAFLYPVDLWRVDLNSIVCIERGHIVVYPSPMNRPMPGFGLNQPALLTFKHVNPRGSNPSSSTIAAFRGMLYQAAARLGATFVHWDHEKGLWVLKVDFFS